MNKIHIILICLHNYFANSKAGTHAPGLYALRPRYSLANKKSCIQTLPLKIFLNCLSM